MNAWTSVLRVSVIWALGGVGRGGRNQSDRGRPHVLTVTTWSQ